MLTLPSQSAAELLIPLTGWGRSRLKSLRILVLALLLALVWLLLGAQPVGASEGMNYDYANLTNQDFSRQELRRALLVGADLRDANFSEADLSQAIFSRASLIGTDLTQANLTGALIDQATLSRVSLRNAIAVDATFTNSVFDQVDITGADFTDALLDRYDIKILCAIASGVNPVTQVDTRASLNCPS